MTALSGLLVFTRDIIRILIPVKGKSSYLSDCHCQAPTPDCWVGLRLAIEIPSLIHTVSVPYSIRMGLDNRQTCRSVLLSKSVLHSCVDRRLNSSSSGRETQATLVDFDRQGPRGHTKQCIPTGRTPGSIPLRHWLDKDGPPSPAFTRNCSRLADMIPWVSVL